MHLEVDFGLFGDSSLKLSTNNVMTLESWGRTVFIVHLEWNYSGLGQLLFYQYYNKLVGQVHIIIMQTNNPTLG